MSRPPVHFMIGAISLLAITVNTLVMSFAIFFLTLFRVIVPLKPWQKVCSKILNAIAQAWVGINNLTQDLTGKTRWKVHGLENLSTSQWYLVLANHQSWTDILVLQRLFNRKIPFLKFFIKRELFWFPILGQAWWALDFPFIKRYSREFLTRNPHMKGKDLEITKRACEKFKTIPIAIMNFVEGTRLTRQKHARQKSPHSHLLRPRAGGIAFVLQAMGGRIHRILDVTICYSEGPISFWAFLSGKISEIQVSVRSIPVTDQLVGDYSDDPVFREQFQQWLNALWMEKDLLLARMKAGKY